MRYRVVESEDGLFYPQCKPGFFSGWRLFREGSDSSSEVLQSLILTGDPAKAARFADSDAAAEFLLRLQKRIADHWARRDEARQRELDGLVVKRVVLPPEPPK